MDDEGIIRLYWDRVETAITETSKKYGKYCFSIAYSILNDHEDSEECVNDTYTKVWNSIPPKKPSILSAFIGRIVRNLALSGERRLRRPKEQIHISLKQVWKRACRLQVVRKQQWR